MNKVKNLQENHEALLGDWNIQYLESAGGTIVNMDYFAVNITTLPNNPSTGQQFTSQQFLDYFRRNINNFVTGTNFSPYCEISAICQQETNLWNSSNPLGAIIKLDISLYKARKVPCNAALKQVNRAKETKRPVFPVTYDPRLPSVTSINGKHCTV